MQLASSEARYQAVTLGLMLEVAAMDDFPNLQQQADHKELVAAAHSAVAQLRKWTAKYGEIAEAQEKLRSDRDAEKAQNEQRRSVARVLNELEASFLTMHSESDHQRRGRMFEGLLNKLFFLFDLNPRKSFVLENEQIDGAFTFSTDDYLLEAKWEKDGAGREDIDVLAQKVQRKGKNTLGLFIAVAGFSEPAVRAHSNCGTGLMFMDGADLFSILEGRIPLSEVLEAKRRHVSETGLPLLLVRDILR
jgi:restriction endonuclease Mrr